MPFTEIFTSFTLSLITNFIVMVGATSFFYWLNASTATPFVFAHRRLLTLVTSFGFMAFLFAQMLNHAYYTHLQTGYHWTYLNMMILTIYLLNLQLGLRWQAIADAGLIVVYYLTFGAPLTILGGIATLIACVTLYLTQANATRLIHNRPLKYTVFAIFAAAILTMVAQMHLATDNWFWFRQLIALSIMAVLCLEFDQLMRLTRQRTDEIHELASIDELTGVHNFGTFNKELDKRFAEFQQNGVPYSVFEGDLDHFKQINDTYGHPSGNIVLKQLALELDAFADTLPFPATAYRLGGEEFAIIAQTPLNHAQAMQIGERFLTLLKLVRFPKADPNLTITCSIGQAHVSAGDYSANDVYKKADRNLYAAKQNGRNCVRAQADNE